MLYHTSPRQINESKPGLFGHFVCFSSKPYVMSAASVVTYCIEDDALEIIEASSLFYDNERYTKLAAHIASVASEFDCDEQTAMNILDESIEVNSLFDEFDADRSFRQQELTAKCAEILGLDGICGSDEQGSVCFIDVRRVIGKWELV